MITFVSRHIAFRQVLRYDTDHSGQERKRALHDPTRPGINTLDARLVDSTRPAGTMGR